MPSTTPNFGFEYPLSSDNLSDGAQSIQDFATTADTTFADLLGGTTGQYLAKNSNTNMDFVWSDLPPAGIVTHIAIRNVDGTAGATVSVFEAAADTFTAALSKRYYFKGIATFSKATTGAGARSISLDLNFNNTAYGAVEWSFVTYDTSAGTTINRQAGQVTADIVQVTAATSSAVTYICYFEGMVESDATNVLTITPQLVNSGAENAITPLGDACWMRIEEWGASGSVEAGAGGWS